MRVIFVGLVLGSAFMIGCGPDIQGMCEASVACAGGNDKDIDACVALADVQHDYLDEIGCGDEQDAYLECTEAYMECSSEQIGISCTMASDCPGGTTCTGGQCVDASYGVTQEGRDACEAERNAFNHCT